MKEKKWFYEQCKNKPADYEENPDKYKDTPYGMFKNSMKIFDEANNILVDVSWRFYTVIIIDCIVFISICLCLISAIRSYNKNFTEWKNAQAVIIEEPDKKLGRLLNQQVVTNGLRGNGRIGKDQYIDGIKLEAEIANKNIVISRYYNFNDIPDFNSNEYGNPIQSKINMGTSYWFCINKSFIDHLDDLILTNLF